MDNIKLVIFLGSFQTKTHESPEVEMRYLESWENVSPVTTSECPSRLDISSPDWKSNTAMDLSVQEVAK